MKSEKRNERRGYDGTGISPLLEAVHFIHRKKESRDTEELICISTYHQKQETVFMIWASQLTPKHQLSWLPKEKKNQNKQNTHVHAQMREQKNINH